MYLTASSATLRSCTLKNSLAHDKGGAIYLTHGSVVKLQSSTLIGSSAPEVTQQVLASIHAHKSDLFVSNAKKMCREQHCMSARSLFSLRYHSCLA